jgi:putative hemolysin
VYLLLILILILINGLFVMAEMALVSSRKGRLQALADKGDKKARTALDLIEHPNRYLSATQIGITLISIMLGMFGEVSLTEDIAKRLSWIGPLAPWTHAIATGLTLVLLTFSTLLLAELVPKRIGQLNPEGLARLIARPMNWISRVSAPLIAVLSLLTDFILRFIPVRPAHEDHAPQEEVKAILASGAEEGTIAESEQQIVERVFQLGEQRVKTLMVPRNDIDTLDEHDTLQRVRVAVATSSHSHFPVISGDLDHLVGVVHVKDLVKHGLISDHINLTALARKPMFVPESATALKVLEQFKRSGSHVAFVLDEYGVLVGLVTLNDLVESMLGEITSAGAPDSNDPMIVKRHDGSYLLDGMVSVAELRAIMEAQALPKQDVADFDTLGGFVMSYLGRVPATGDRFSFDRYTFEIMDMDRTRVDRVLLVIEPVPAPVEGQPAE